MFLINGNNNVLLGPAVFRAFGIVHLYQVWICQRRRDKEEQEENKQNVIQWPRVNFGMCSELSSDVHNKSGSKVSTKKNRLVVCVRANLAGWLLQNVQELGAGGFHFIGRFIYLRG